MSRASLRLGQWLLFSVGTAALAYSGYVYWDSWAAQARQSRQLDLALDRRPVLSPHLPGLRVRDGEVIGRLDVARLDLSVIFSEGVKEVTLRRGAGHIPGTALPGQPGNVGISAHRDTFFRPLRNVRRDDKISITTTQGVFRYQVTSTSVVPPTEVSVLFATELEVLTLVTCYPFFFVGPAPSRFIVRAKRVGQ